MPEKRFLTYEQQINLLKSKNLTIENDELAKTFLARYGYYSLISGYKGIFKIERNGNYRQDATFDKIVRLYTFDEYLRHSVLHEIIRIEKNIRSLYSYSFCNLYGDNQNDYLNANNYNYSMYQTDINTFISKVQGTLRHPENYPCVHYNVRTYNSVPLWVIIQTITFGSLSKMFMFSKQQLQSQIARNYDSIYPNQLSKMLNVLSKFRNVCAHGERLYNFKTHNSIPDLPIHHTLQNYNPTSKNDLFSVILCFKCLSTEYDYKSFLLTLERMIDITEERLGSYYTSKLLSEMGFPENWKDIK